MKSKIIGFVIVLTPFLIFIFLLYMHILWTAYELNFPLSPYVYLSLLAWWSAVILFFKLTSGVTLWVGFSFFIAGSLFTTLSMYNISEPLFRFSFVFFIIGFTQSLLEYVRPKK